MSTLRYVLFVALAAAVTLGAFFLMHKLIDGPVLAPTSDERVQHIRFGPVDLGFLDEPPPPKPPEPPPPPDQPPPPPNVETVKITAVDIPMDLVEHTLDLGPSGVPIRQGTRHPPSSDQSATVVNALPPPYPRQAAMDGVEGWVKVQFLVTATGAVRDVRVLDASPQRVFDRAAVDAVRRWTFRPRMEDGHPREQVVTQIVEFTLEQAR